MKKIPTKLNNKQNKKLQELFAQNGVIFGYQFGSTVDNDKLSELSDYDFAVLFKKDEIIQDEVYKKELKISSKLRELLRFDKIDVINLDEVTPLMKYNAVIKGKPIFYVDEDERILFENRVLREYEDTGHLRKLFDNMQQNRIKKGIFGTKGPLEKKYVTRD